MVRELTTSGATQIRKSPPGKLTYAASETVFELEDERITLVSLDLSEKRECYSKYEK